LLQGTTWTSKPLGLPDVTQNSHLHSTVYGLRAAGLCASVCYLAEHVFQKSLICQ